jgi:hypothetical protein
MEVGGEWRPRPHYALEKSYIAVKALPLQALTGLEGGGWYSSTLP